MFDVAGPGPWPLQPSGHYAEVVVGDSSLVTATRVGDPNLYTWRIKVSVHLSTTDYCCL